MEGNEIKLLIAGIVVGLSAGILAGRSIWGGTPQPTAQPQVIGPAAAGPGAPAGPAGPGGAGPQIPHESIEALVQRAKDNPADYEVRVQIANLTFDNNLYDLAAKYYEEALALNDGDPNVITDLGVSYRRLKQPARAVELFERAVEKTPEHLLAWFNIAVVKHFDLGDPAGAQQALDRVKEIDPSFQGIPQLEAEMAKSTGATP